MFQAVPWLQSGVKWAGNQKTGPSLGVLLTSVYTLNQHSLLPSLLQAQRWVWGHDPSDNTGLGECRHAFFWKMSLKLL